MKLEPYKECNNKVCIVGRNGALYATIINTNVSEVRKGDIFYFENIPYETLIAVDNSIKIDGQWGAVCKI